MEKDALRSQLRSARAAVKKLEARCRVLESENEVLTRELAETKAYQKALEGSGVGLWSRELSDPKRSRSRRKKKKSVSEELRVKRGGEVYYSESWKEMLGFKETEFPSDHKAWRNRIHPDDWPRVYESMSGHIRGEKDHPVYQCEYRLKAKNGHYRWIRTFGKTYAVDCPDGTTKRLIGGTHFDITLYRTIFEKIDTFIWLKRYLPNKGKRKQFQFEFVSKSLADFFEHSEVEVVGESDYGVGSATRKECDDFYEDDLEVIKSERGRLIDAEPISHKKSGVKTVKTLKIPYWTDLREGGKPSHVLGIADDISELQHLMSNSPDAVYFKVPKGKFIRANKALAELVGLDEEELPGMTNEEVFDEKTCKEANADEEFLIENPKESLLNIEREFQFKGTYRKFLINKTPIVLGGEVKQIVVICRDLTEKFQDWRIQSLGHLVHLFAPFTNNLPILIECLADSIRSKETEEGNRPEDWLARMGQETSTLRRRANLILGHLLSFPERRPVKSDARRKSLGGLLKTAVLRIKEEAKFYQKRVRWRVGTSDRIIRVPLTLKQEVLLNAVLDAILHNAMKNCKHQVTVSLKKLKRGWTIRIRDDGEGLDERDLEHAFEFGYKRRKGGLGLGLSLAQLFCESSGWECELRNHPSGGAEFSMKSGSRRLKA